MLTGNRAFSKFFVYLLVNVQPLLVCPLFHYINQKGKQLLFKLTQEDFQQISSWTDFIYWMLFTMCVCMYICRCMCLSGCVENVRACDARQISTLWTIKSSLVSSHLTFIHSISGKVTEYTLWVVPSQALSLHPGEAGARSNHRPDHYTGQQLVQEPQAEAEGPNHGHDRVSDLSIRVCIVWHTASMMQ